MFLLSTGEFIGRFHPLLVHLPIGILVVACIFQWLVLREKFSGLQQAIPVLLLWGGLAAAASCISGYLLSDTADYPGDLVSSHQWLGIATAIVSLGFYFLYQRKEVVPYLKWLAAIVLVLVTITGHIGGSLTHGEGYLTEMLSFGKEEQKPLPAIPMIQEAALYKDVVTPILEARCYSCHGATKQKGKLRLDSKAAMEKGGEEGELLVPGKPEESELIKRILLSMDAKKHMPPKNKSQLTQEEIDLLHWWVSQGADFSRKVKDFQQNARIKPVLIALESGKTGLVTRKPADEPEGTVQPAPADKIEALQKAGVSVVPISRNSNFLGVDFISALSVDDALIRQLEPLKDQLVSVKMDGVKLSDSAISVLAACKQLRKLQLNNTGITDAQVQKLATLVNLRSLNLVGTPVTANGLGFLSKLPQLQRVYLYKSGVSGAAWPDLQRQLKGVTLDSGNYAVPTLHSDTTIVTEAQ